MQASLHLKVSHSAAYCASIHARAEAPPAQTLVGGNISHGNGARTNGLPAGGRSRQGI
jgi:hypothetical protein